MNAKQRQPLPPGTICTNLQLPEDLHETMKTLRLIRQQTWGSGLKLNRIYREAVEQYINAKPQQQLLKEWGKDARPHRSGDRLAVRV